MKWIKRIVFLMTILTMLLATLAVGCEKSDTYKIVYQQASGKRIELVFDVGKVPTAKQIPNLETKVGYTGEWDKDYFAYAKVGDVITVNPVYTPKTYELILKDREYHSSGDKVRVTYGEAYDLSDIVPSESVSYVWGGAWLYKGIKIDKSGVWDKDITASQIELSPFWQVKVTFVRYGSPNVEKIIDVGASLTMEDFPEIVNVSGYEFIWENNALKKVTNVQSNVTVYTTIDPTWSPWV